MSDHWNGIANLLGTPSLNPIKKQEASSKTSKPSVESPDESLPRAVDEPVSKPKAEPSRLRSSWDAVAQFFGVAPTDSPAETQVAREEPSPRSQSIEPKSSVGAGRRSKPSMWGEPEREATPAPAALPEVISAERTEREKPSFEHSKREPRGREKSRDRSPSARRPDVEFDADAPSDSIEPDRRSVRRPPRRGRSNQDAAVSERPATEFVDEPESEVNESPTRRPHRDAGAARSDGTMDRERKGRGREDRQERSDRSERPERSSERSERPERSERSERRPSRSDAPRLERSSSEESSGDRRPQRGRDETSSRQRDYSGDRRPPAKTGKPSKPAGFGAGLIDDEPEFLFVDDEPPELVEFDSLDESSEDVPVAKSDDLEDREARPKRRRGRGRGKRRDEDSPEREVSDRDSREIESDDLSSTEGSRNTRIPSWQEAIGALVATNMENHQRNPGHGRNSRGRGFGRDRN